MISKMHLWEQTPMKRLLGVSAVLIFWIWLSPSSFAQSTQADWYGPGSYDQGFRGVDGFPSGNGGFGMGHTQGPPASGVYMNQWGQVIGETYPASGPIVTYAPPTAAPTNRRTGRAPLQRRYAVTTGMLGWPGGTAVPVYPSAGRYTSYGNGYALSPYGTVNYYGGFRGYTLGN